MATGASRVGQALDAVERAAKTAETADELLEGVSRALHKTVPYDGATYFGVDPVTLLATAPSRVEGLDDGYCDIYWHLEFHEQDTGLFSDLARGDGVSALRLALDDRPARSIRYREFMKPQGYDDELRAVFRNSDNVWGVVGLYREASRPAFDEDDLSVMSAVSPVVANALRKYVRDTSPWLGQPSAPGLVVIDRDGKVVSANAEALSWLRELWPMSPATAELDIDSLDVFALRDQDFEVPTALFALVSRARAVAEGRERAPARLRLPDRRGRWIVLHASPLAGPGSPDGGSVAVVIEAAKSAEVAPIIIEAYSLTARERDVLGAIARGGSTAEIAAELFLSPHTVRDHVKAVFEKLGVSSRGELVARVFGEHYTDRLHETMVHAD
ncbi:MAG TPA: LuxR C-terminal-related transcriptional regulator [Acidimicrobiia bacterium]|nr:LuxR C-terminal-related transcriptional regulator [Acidimicrobiia bacterium]